MEEYYKEKIKNNLIRRTIKKIIVNIIYIILLAIIIYDMIILIQSKENPDSTPSVFGIKTFCVVSGSMEPNININDIIIVQEVEQNQINTGDIISFTKDGETITHRVINIETDVNGEIYYTTQGDANNVPDKEKVAFKNIEGKVVFKIPKIGEIVIALQQKSTLMLVLIILIIIYIIEQRINRKKEKRNNERIDYENGK
jgi:signal peptidase